MRPLARIRVDESNGPACTEGESSVSGALISARLNILIGAAMFSVGVYLAISPWVVETYWLQVLAEEPITIFGIGVPESPGNPSHWIFGSGIALMSLGLAAVVQGLASEIGHHINLPTREGK